MIRFLSLAAHANRSRLWLPFYLLPSHRAVSQLDGPTGDLQKIASNSIYLALTELTVMAEIVREPIDNSEPWEWAVYGSKRASCLPVLKDYAQTGC